MEKKQLHRLVCLVAVTIAISMAVGCAAKQEPALPQVELLAYTVGEGDSWAGDGSGWCAEARTLSVDLAKGEITLAPAKKPERQYVVNEKENVIWYSDYKLIDHPKNKQAVLQQGEQTLGIVEHLAYDGMALHPMAFFVDQEGRLVVMCQRGDGTSWNEGYPVSVVAERRAPDSDRFVIRQVYSYAGMFSEKLSKVQGPFYTRFQTNIYGNGETGTFLWNEGRSLVEINPYDGKHVVILDETKIKKDMPDLDTRREGYGLFNGFSWQNGIYIALLSRDNQENASYAIFYNEEKAFLGRLLCCMGEGLTYYDRKGEALCRVEEKQLWPFLYVAQGR